MRQYYSNNKNYNAILESMAQIRENQLNEAYGSMPHRGGGMSGASDRMAQGQIPLNAEAMHGDEEEMEEGMHGDEEEMEERYMYEGEHEDDEDAQMEALAEMMDEALMELDDDDDNDNQMLGEEEDDERRARRRARLRNALLIGAGLVATGGLAGAALMNPTARGMIAKGAGEAFTGIKDMAGGVAQAGYGMLPQTTRDQIAGGVEAGQEYVDSTVMPATRRATAAADLAAQQALSKYGKPARQYASKVQRDLGIKAKDMKFMDTPQAQSFGDDSVTMGRFDYNDPSAYIKKRASGYGAEF